MKTFREFMNLNEAIYKYTEKSTNTKFGMNSKEKYLKIGNDQIVLNDFDAFKKSVLSKSKYKEKGFGSSTDDTSIYIKIGNETIIIDGKDFVEFKKAL